MRKRDDAQGFSLTGLLLTIAFTTVLLAMAVPTVGSLRDEAAADEVLDLVSRLREGCLNHYRDTGAFAIEFSPAQGGHSYTQPRYHELSMTQRRAGWRGPYLERPLRTEDNPFGGAVYLQNHLSASPASGFDLKGMGDAMQSGPGQFVVLYSVPERIAAAVDSRLDDGIPNSAGEGWRRTGRVEWSPSSGGALMIHLMAAE